MTAAVRNDLIDLVKRWDAELDALKLAQAEWPMNHVHWRIYEGMRNQQLANLGEIVAVIRKHDGADQVERKLNDALVENYNLKQRLEKLENRE